MSHVKGFKQMYSSLLQVATLLKVYVRHQLYLYEEAVGGGLKMVPASAELEGYAGKTLYVSEAVSVCVYVCETACCVCGAEGDESFGLISEPHFQQEGLCTHIVHTSTPPYCPDPAFHMMRSSSKTAG